MVTRASIGCKMGDGKIYYVECRYDGYLEHVGRILAERYNDLGKVLGLLLGGDIVSLRDDGLGRIERVSPLERNQLEDCEVKEASCIEDYLLNGRGKYKYLFKRGRWYVVDGLCENDCFTPLRRPISVAKAIEIWLM